MAPAVSTNHLIQRFSTNKVVHRATLKVTPLKFNMEPENGPLEREIPLGNHHFQVLC